jgi:hypothetical protein
MRIYRSNPFDGVGRLPAAPRALLFAIVAALVLGGAGLWAEREGAARRGAEVERALVAQGYGAATVDAVRGRGCGRGRRSYTWKTATAAGVACAGGGREVEVRVAGR